MNPSLLTCFKQYDIRGKVPSELNETIAYGVGRAFVDELDSRTVVVGWDVRRSSEELAGALAKGLCDAGASVLDIGLCATEELYFATCHLGAQGGIMVTASHNPADYNGMKLIKARAIPVHGGSGLFSIRDRVAENSFKTVFNTGSRQSVNCREVYVQHLLGYVTTTELKPLRLVVNSGNGCAGPILDRLAPHLPLQRNLSHF